MRIFIAILYTLAVITALLMLLSALWLRLCIVYNNETGPRIWVQILFFKIYLFPEKQPKINLRDFKIKRFRRLERKRALETEKKSKKKRKRAAKESKKEIQTVKEPLLDKVSFILRIVSKLLSRFSRYLHIDVSKLYIKISSDDAAKTAYLYSAVSQSVAYLTKLLASVTSFDVKKNACFTVLPDFSSEEPEFEADFVFRIRIFNLSRLGVYGLRLLSDMK